MTTETAEVQYPDTPELDRQSEVIDDCRVITAFLEWLQDEKGLDIVKMSDLLTFDPVERWYDGKDYQELLADYFDINLKKIEAERRAVIDYVRANQTVANGRKH